MADKGNNRLDDAALDANLSVLGDDKGEPSIGRVAEAPLLPETGDMEETLARADGEDSGGNLDETSQKAAREAARDSVDGFGKTPTSP